MGKAGKAKGGSRQAQPTVALYGLDAGGERGDAVRAVMDGLGVRVRTVGPENLDDFVGAVAGLPGMRMRGKAAPQDVPCEEFMLVCSMDGPKLDEVLAAMRAAGVPVAHKAMLTSHNRLWPLRVLMAEVAREHAAMMSRAQD